LRAEYSHIPQHDFMQARQRILRKLLARPSLFLSPLSERWEEPARQNVTAELSRVEKELGKLEVQEAGSEAPAAPADGEPVPASTATHPQPGA
ncbi:MAG: hypothetical protein J0I40_02335, partial [Cellulomonas sp.]|nr:hypothetical protein [Cellulomonas sp.]